MADGSDSVLRRKAVPPAASSARLTPERALKIAFGRAARGLPGLELRLTAFAMEESSVAGTAAVAPERALVLLLQRDGRCGGALIADPGFVSALVEAETTGRVARNGSEARSPTRIDALIVESLLDVALAAFDDLAAELPYATAATGWRVGEMLNEPAALPLALAEAPLRLMHLGFEFAGGSRKGELWLAAPVAAAPADAPRSGAQRLEPAILAVRAEVRAVLARIELPLDIVTGWQAGTTLPITRSALDEIRLEDISGEPVGRGKLGQINGMRAIRLCGGSD